jgi:hypothetical protein
VDLGAREESAKGSLTWPDQTRLEDEGPLGGASALASEKPSLFFERAAHAA